MPDASGTMNGAPIVSSSGPVFAKSRCRCGGLMLELVDDFVSWNHCIACGRPELIAWASYRSVALGLPRDAKAGNEPDWGQP